MDLWCEYVFMKEYTADSYDETNDFDRRMEILTDYRDYLRDMRIRILKTTFIDNDEISNVDKHLLETLSMLCNYNINKLRGHMVRTGFCDIDMR